MKLTTKIQLLGYFSATGTLVFLVFVPEILFAYFLIRTTALYDNILLILFWMLSSLIFVFLYALSCFSFGIVHSQFICKFFLPKVTPGKFHHTSDEAKLYAVVMVSPAIYKSLLKGFSFVPHLYSMLLARALRFYGLECGSNVYIASGAVLDSHLVSIGDNSFVGMRAIISSHANENRILTLSPVKIGNNVTIGGYAIIAPGAQIGDNSIIGIHSFVKKNQIIPPNSVYAGVPAKLLRKLDESNTSTNLKD